MCVDTVFSGHICPYFIGQSDSKVGGQTGGERRACKSNPCCNWHLCFFAFCIIGESTVGPGEGLGEDMQQRRRLEARLLLFSLAANGCVSPMMPSLQAYCNYHRDDEHIYKAKAHVI